MQDLNVLHVDSSITAKASLRLYLYQRRNRGVG